MTQKTVKSYLMYKTPGPVLNVHVANVIEESFSVLHKSAYVLIQEMFGIYPFRPR
jgi:hypothetical protein